MSKMRVLNLVVVLALALGALPLSSGSGAQAAAASPVVQPAAVQATPTTQGGSGFDRTLLAPHPLPLAAEEGVAEIDSFLRQQEGPLHIVIELEGDPTTVVYARTLAAAGAQFQAQATRAAQAQLARIETAQQQLLAPLAQLDATVLYRVQRVYNGIAAIVDAQHLDQIAALPGVKAIHRLVPKTLEHTTSVPLIGAPELWTETNLDLTGAGITIGIIDSGVDYVHTDFGGSGADDAYAANDTTVITDTYNGALLFPTAKVVGGFDFAGDAYDAGGDTVTQTVPHPDPDPAGCLIGGESADHGTHVAGTAAGYGVNQDGTTYTGPYNSTLDFDQFRIGPGVAPEASLYSLRVFGCNGSTDLAEAAIEWAMDPNEDGDFSDHLDIINMSLGSPYGSDYDYGAIVSNNAALAGMIVVASAGNETDVYYVTGSPATGSRVLSVAASRDRGAVLDGFSVNAPSSIAGVYGAALSVAYDWDSMPGVTGAVVYPDPGANPAQDQRTGCYTFDITNTQMISGNIVILDWNEPSCGGSVSRTGRAVAAGATGVIIVDNSVIFDLLITGSAVVPSISAPKSVGDMLKANLSGLNASLVVDYRNSVMFTDTTMEDTLASFSSRGPRRYDSALKPDITAPGDSIFSAGNGTGNEGLSYGGTSMSAPHMSGAMALLRQLHPDWSVEELKALVMDTAFHDVHTDPPAAPVNYGPGRVGAGRADLAKAATSPLIAYVNDGSGLVSLSFGAPEISAPYTVTQQVRVANKGPNLVVYTARYQSVVDMPGVEVTVSPALIRLPPYRFTIVQVTMTADPAQMMRALDPTVDPYAGGDARHWLSEESGYLVLEPGYQNRLYLPLVVRNYSGGAQPSVPIAANTPTALRLAVFAAPRAVAAMQAVQTGFTFTTVTATVAISLTGQGIDDGDVLSLVSAFELQEVNPDDSWTSGIADSADLKYVGVTNDFRATGAVASTNVYFAIATWGDHSTPSPYDSEFDIYIDTTLDGTPDYALYNGVYFAGADPTDIYYTTLVNLSTGAALYVDYLNGIPADVLDTAAFNTNVMILPVPASLLGLIASSPQFTYYVRAYSREYGLVDGSDTYIYTAGMPGLDFGGGYPGVPIWSDLPGNSIPVIFDATPYVANGSQGILLLHHHNGMAGRTEVLTVTPPDDIAVVNLLHTNDFHGNLELAGSNPGIARMAAVINTVSNAVGAANVRLVDAGDEMQGSLLSNLKHGEPTIDLFNFVGYDAATFGNHEFDWGQTVLISRTEQADYPFIAANLVVSDNVDCASAGWTAPAFATPWITMTVGAPGNQVVVGLIGVTSQETPYITIASATQGLCFKDPAESIINYYDAVDAASDVIVVLSHIGNTDGGYGYGLQVYGDQTLARMLVEAGKPVPLIIGGHSHTDLTAAQVVSGTTVVQAHYSGRKVGRAILTVNKTSGAVSVSWQRLVVNTTGRQDPLTQVQLATWTSDPAYQSTVNQVIGFSNVDLVRDYNGDSLMGKFVNDAIYNDLNTDGTSANDADMVFNNPGGIRVDLTSATKPFTLTYGMLFSVLPFGNQTIVGDMNGAQILELLNQSATLFKGALQVSGIRYTFYSYTDTVSSQQPWAWGAYSVTVRNRNTSLWEPLVMTRTYRVATNEFLAPAGQDGFVPFKYMTNISYWGDMLDGVIRWVSANYTITSPYSETLDGRITRDGTSAGGSIIPMTILHHNDSHGRLLPSGSAPGYTNLAALIQQERQHNPTRTLLLNSGDQIQGDAMMAFYKAAFTGQGSDGTTLPITLTTNPIIAAMNAMTYTAMTLGNHEFNFGNYVFTGTLGQATFPLLQANLYDNGQYGIAQVPIEDSVTTTVGAEGIRVAILGIGNHRVPQYELPSNIPGLTFTDPITEAQARVPALDATNDVVIALTHIGFTSDPASVEVDTRVDTELAGQTVGVDAIIGGHSHTNPATAFPPYKYLPAIVGAPDNTPVIINQAYRYNSYLGEVVLGLLPDGGGGYQVVARAGRYIQVSASGAQDAAIRAIVKPYDDFLATYRNRVVGTTSVPLDATNAFITETNATNLQVDASLWKLNSALPDTEVQFHLSGAMADRQVAATATTSNPYTLTVDNMFTLMPYENSLVVMRMNGPQLKTILERAYRNYWYYKYTGNYGGYSHYTTCMLDISAGGVITYDEDPITYTASVSYVVGLSINGDPVDFLDATTYYTVSTVNYLAAGSCNFSDGGVTLWPLSEIVADTQYYVRDVVIEYIPTLTQPIAPAVEGRVRIVQLP